MTTQTATSDLPFAPQGPVSAQALAEIANALFKALPGQEPANLTPPNLSPQALSPQGLSPLTLTGAVPTAPVAAEAQPLLAGNALHGLRQGLLPDRNQQPYIPATPVAAPTMAFYFLNPQDLPLTFAGQGLQPLGADQAHAVSQPQLAALVSGLSPSSPERSQTAPYYFLTENSIAIERRPEHQAAPRDLRFDVQQIRRDFPILSERVNGKPLVWFDNAATTHKPQSVIDRIGYFYQHENSNIHRAAHALAARATDAYEAARDKVARFIGAKSSQEIIFVRGATEGLNLLANVLGQALIQAGDEILVSLLEHHANIVPWQLLAQKTGAVLKVIPVDDSGQLRLDQYRQLLSAKTKIVSVTQVSNALGTVTPIDELIALAHQVGAKVIVDAAQSVSHLAVNVQALDADFLVFSGHKIFGPTGIGVVYGKAELLGELPPYQGGGNMIADVTFEHTQFQPAPNLFEAGTGNIADAVGLGEALDYVSRIGLSYINAYEHQLLAYITDGLLRIPGVRLIGTAAHKASVASFVLQGYSTEQVGKALNEQGIAVRSGHHCAQPILRRFGVETTVRPSLAFYNTCDEIDLFLSVIQRLSRNR